MTITITDEEYQELMRVKREYERLKRLEGNVKNKIKELEGYMEAFPGALEHVNTEEKLYLLESLDQ